MMLAWVAYGIIALVWGSTYFAIRIGLVSFTPYGMVAFRFLVGALIAFGLGRLRKEPLPRKSDLKHLAFTGALMLSGSNALVSWSETVVTSGFAATVCAMVPVFLALFSGGNIGRRAWIGLGAGLLGVAIMADPLHGGLHWGGLAALLAANILWAFATLWGKKRVQGHEAAFGNTAVQMLTAGVIAVGLAPLFGGYTHGPITRPALLAVSYLALFGSVIAFSAYTYLARVWAPAKMGTYAYLNPMVAVLLGVLPPLRETLTPRVVVGMFVILLGVALVQLGPMLRRSEEPA